ncbi:MAG: hypothetical protein PHX21_12880 [bacterium]|nr:hypothetical protein [bacterium]
MGYLVERQVNSQTNQINSVISVPVKTMLDIGTRIDKMVMGIYQSYMLAGKKSEWTPILNEWNTLPKCTGIHLEETDYICLTNRLKMAIPFMDSLMKKIVVDMPNSTTLWTKIKHLWGIGSPTTYTGWADVIREWGQLKDKIPTIQKEADIAYIKFEQEKKDKENNKNKILKTITTVVISLAAIVGIVKVAPIISKFAPKRRA